MSLALKQSPTRGCNNSAQYLHNYAERVHHNSDILSAQLSASKKGQAGEPLEV